MSKNGITYVEAGSFIAEADGPCAFCGGRIIIGHDNSPEQRPGVLHTRPECTTFVAMEPLDFLVANRRKLGIPDPQEPS